MKRAFRFIIILAVILALAGTCYAVIRDGEIRGKRGLTFSEVKYSFNKITLTISNSTKHNITFGGSMIFLDRHHKVIARAELMKGKIKRYSSRKYKASFTIGSGNEAKSARYVEWDF